MKESKAVLVLAIGTCVTLFAVVAYVIVLLLIGLTRWIFA